MVPGGAAMKSGGHAPNAPFVEACGFRVAGMTSAKVMWYHSDAELQVLRRAGAQDITMRLPDTGPFRDSVDRAAQAWTKAIRWGMARGIFRYQCDNEPQWQAAWRDAPWIWRWFLETLIIQVRRDVPGMYQLGLTPLSYAPSLWPTLDLWREMLIWHDPERPHHLSLAQRVEFACANCYWQTEGQMRDLSFGGAFMDVHLRTHLPVVVAEYGNSLTDKVPRPDDGAIEAAMLNQYPHYLEWLEQFDYVQDAFLFIMGGTPRWSGFWPSDRVLRAMAR